MKKVFRRKERERFNFFFNDLSIFFSFENHYTRCPTEQSDVLTLVARGRIRDEGGRDEKDRKRTGLQRRLQLGQNAFIYIQKSQVKYTYYLRTINGRRAREKCGTRVSFSFSFCARSAAQRVHRQTVCTAFPTVRVTAEQCALFSILYKDKIKRISGEYIGLL